MWNRILSILWCILFGIYCQAQPAEAGGKKLVGKTNALLWAVLVPNIGAEYVVNDHYSIDFPIAYTPYSIKRNFMLKCLLVQPEFRYWLDTPLYGHFIGVHLHAGYFNVAVNRRSRYQDGGANEPLLGFGLSYGYNLQLSPRLHLEFTFGAGYAHIRYDTFYNIPHGAQFASQSKNYWGITRLGVSFTYLIKSWKQK